MITKSKLVRKTWMCAFLFGRLLLLLWPVMAAMRCSAATQRENKLSSGVLFSVWLRQSTRSQIRTLACAFVAAGGSALHSSKRASGLVSHCTGFLFIGATRWNRFSPEPNKQIFEYCACGHLPSVLWICLCPVRAACMSNRPLRKRCGFQRFLVLCEVTPF